MARRNLKSLLVSSAACVFAIGVDAARAAPTPILPTGGQVVAGSATIVPSSATSLTINQSSAKAILTWNNFSIGQGGTVQFNNGSGSTLNRVTGLSASQIDGLLSGTGSVYVINPNGVIIGKTGVVNTGGTFAASTLDIANTAFLAGGNLTFSGASTSAVINYGKIGSLGGDVTLIASTVDNAGQITAPNGDVGLLAGYTVTLYDSTLNDGKFAVQVGGADTSVTNSGLVQGAEAELRANGGNIYALAGNTSSVIKATGVSANDGKVFLVAEGGTLDVAGTVSAVGANGQGGSIETSGQTLDLGQAKITTGQGGQWLLDPATLTIDASLASTIDASLAGGTNVTEQADQSLTVAAPIAWSTSAGLTLTSGGTLSINAPITISGAGQLTLNYSTASATNLSFGTGAAVNFGATAITGQALTINNTAYTLLYTMSDLTGIDSKSDSGNYALATSLTAPTTAYTNALIGAGSNTFSGIFEGLGNTITGLTIDAPSSSDVGLFGQSGGTIRDIGLIGGSVSGFSNVGDLVGYQSAASITNAYATGSVSGKALDVGGLVGAQEGGSIMNAYATGAVSGSNYVGGLVGYQSAASITNAYATGAVSGTITVGGLVGFQYGGSITNAYATGAVSGNNIVGGLVGYQDSGSITNAYATGVVGGPGAGAFGGGAFGGLVGYQYGGSITNAYATGAVSGNNTVGGLVGDQDSGSITNAYATGAVSGQYYVGGLVGYGQGSITNAYATGAVSGTADYVGGLVGDQYSGSITNAYATGVVSGQKYVGGLVGFQVSGSVNNGYYDTNTTGQTSDNGGAIGLTTAQLQGLAPITGSTYFSIATNLGDSVGTVWAGGAKGLYPYLTFQFPNGTPQAVSGFVYGANGTTGLSGASVTTYANGSALTDALTGAGASTGANGYYYELLAPGTLTGGKLGASFTPAGSTTVAGLTYTDQATGSTPSLNLTTDFISLTTAEATQSALISDVNATFGSATYAGFAAALPGANINETSPVSFTVDQAISTTGDLTLQSGGSLALNATISANSVVLSATGAFINEAGSAAVSTLGGVWNIYSANPTGDQFDGLNSNNTAVWGTAAGAAISQTGDRYIFANSPTLTVSVGNLSSSVNGNLSKTYGQDATASVATDYTISGLQAGVTGAYLGDTAASVYSGAPTVTSTGAAATASSSVVNGGDYAITVSATGLTVGDGYTLAIAPSSATLHVNQATVTATLTGTVSKTYDSNDVAPVTPGDISLSGVYAGDSVSVTQPSAGQYASVNVGTNILVGATGFSLTGAQAGDYTLSNAFAFGNVGTITPEAITVTAVGGSKVYNASTASSLTPTVTSGTLYAGDATLSESYNSKDVATATTLTPAETFANAATAGDYVVTNMTASGSITPAAVTATLIGTVSKTYDGNVVAPVTPGNISLSGVYAGDSVSATQPSAAQYASATVGTDILVGATGFSLTGAQAGDYTLSNAFAFGNVGTITPKP